MGGASGVGRSRARARFFAALRSAQNDKVIFILRRILPSVILRSAATKDLALARFHTRMARRVVAPYEAENTVQTTAPPGLQHPSRRSEQSGRDGRALRAPAGWQPLPFILQQQVGGSRKAGQRLYARSAS